MGYENQILNNAIAAFKNITDLPANVLAKNIRLPDGIADAEIQLADTEPLLVEIKGHQIISSMSLAERNPGSLFHRVVIEPLEQQG